MLVGSSIVVGSGFGIEKMYLRAKIGIVTLLLYGFSGVGVAGPFFVSIGGGKSGVPDGIIVRMGPEKLLEVGIARGHQSQDVVLFDPPGLERGVSGTEHAVIHDLKVHSDAIVLVTSSHPRGFDGLRGQVDVHRNDLACASYAYVEVVILSPDLSSPLPLTPLEETQGTAVVVPLLSLV